MTKQTVQLYYSLTDSVFLLFYFVQIKEEEEKQIREKEMNTFKIHNILVE